MLVAPSHFVSTPAIPETASSLAALYFRGSELLVQDDGASWAQAEFENEFIATLPIGRQHDTYLHAHRIAVDIEPPSGTRFANLRSLFATLPSDQLAIACLANQLLEWDRTHRFCGACGTPTVREASERARRCPSCGLSSYPRISPAMMCLVTRGKDILLARNVNFPAGRYSALAGFLEAGESIEDAVHREVREEVGVRVKNLRY
ncbi:MAG: NAD(+) diphosphatase, partial [Casimicrobium sp.]